MENLRNMNGRRYDPETAYNRYRAAVEVREKSHARQIQRLRRGVNFALGLSVVAMLTAYGALIWWMAR